MAQRNYLINTTTIATAASGTTIGSGNTQDAAFVVARTLVRTGIGAGEFSSGTQTWSVHYVVSAMTTPYNMRLKVQRRNSSGVMQAESGYGATRSTTGTYDDNLSADLGTWAANDQLALVWEHFRPSGSGNKNATIDANGASYIDAPTTAATPLTQSASDDLNNWADAAATVLGQREQVSDSLNNWLDEIGGDLIHIWQDSVNTALVSAALTLQVSDVMTTLTDGTGTVEIIGYDLIIGDDLSLWADGSNQHISVGLVVSDALPAFSDSVEAQISIRLTVSDDANNFGDSVSLRANGFLTLSDDGNNWLDAIAQVGSGLLPVSDTHPTLTDAIASQLSIGLTVFDDANNLSDSFTQRDDGLLTPSDDANNFLDAYSQIADGRVSVDDSFELSDSVATELDSITSNLQLNISDNANNLLDAVSLLANGDLTLSDDADNLTDSLTWIGDGLVSLNDTFSLSDDVELLSDGQLTLSDDANALSDSAGFTADGLVSLSDAFELSDSLSFSADGFHVASDSLAQSDSLSLGYGVGVSDSLTLTDGIGLLEDLQLGLSDDLNNWQEIFLTSGTEIRVSAGDSLNNWQDSFARRMNRPPSDFITRVSPQNVSSEGVVQDHSTRVDKPKRSTQV